MSTVFDFFGLPLELRNSIYRELARQRAAAVKSLPFGWHAMVWRYPEPALLLVSRQFGTEYQDEIYRHATMKIAFEMWNTQRGKGLRAIQLPGILWRNINYLELGILDGELEEIKHVLEEADMLLRVCNLPKLRTLKIEFVVNSQVVERWFDDDAEAGSALRSKAELVTSVLVSNELYQAFTAGFTNNLEEEVEEEFQDAVRGIPGNAIDYQASPCEDNDPYSFYGLHLEVVRCGYFDAEQYDALVGKMLATWEGSDAEE